MILKFRQYMRNEVDKEWVGWKIDGLPRQFKCKLSPSFIIILMSEMSGVGKTQEINYSELQKSKVVTNSDYIDSTSIYNVELTVSQANAISRILPKCYIIHVDRAIKTKRSVKRTFTLDKKNNKSKDQFEDQAQLNDLPQQPIYEQIQTINYEEMIKRCQKILNLLRKNKNAWPFKEPVDPIAMGIPHYRDIVLNPMDLQTAEENLLANKYTTMSQFYADIQLIINNSFTFNKSNVQFYTLTSEFQKYFQKLKQQPFASTANVVIPPIKKVASQASTMSRQKSEVKPVVQISQRKQLYAKLKQLSKQELTQLVAKLNQFGQKTSELNLQTLSVQKIKFIQDYLQKKGQTSYAQNTKAKELPKKPTNVESEFQSDSDS